MTLPGFYPATVMPDADWWNALWPAPEKVLAALGVNAGIDLAIDLCCGDGLFTAPLARLARQRVAIDLDPEMIAQARARLGDTPCTLLVGDAYHLAEMVAMPADLVFMANTFHGVPDKPRLAHAVALTLNPEGRFIVVNWHARPRDETTVLGQPRGPKTELRLEPGDVQREVAPAGLLLSKIIELPPYHYVAIFRRSA
jgi:SAM-dependent methyltransferase